MYVYPSIITRIIVCVTNDILIQIIIYLLLYLYESFKLFVILIDQQSINTLLQIRIRIYLFL